MDITITGLKKADYAYFANAAVATSGEIVPTPVVQTDFEMMRDMFERSRATITVSYFENEKIMTVNSTVFRFYESGKLQTIYTDNGREVLNASNLPKMRQEHNHH